MLVLNFNLYLVPLGILLAFLKQYVIHVLLTERNINPEDQVSLGFGAGYCNNWIFPLPDFFAEVGHKWL